MEQQSRKEVSIPMTTLDPRPEPYAPRYPSSYPPQSYPPQSYGPEKYTPDSYLPQPCSGEPYTPTEKQFASAKTATLSLFFPLSSLFFFSLGSDGCCGECPSPPPYSCEDVPCDRVGPVCMTNNPPVVVAGIFSSKPASTICPCCRQIITTEVVYRVGSLTYAVCTGMCMMGCCLGCCLLPFMTNCFKDVDHYCPHCRYHIYRYKRL
ncbi:lipopolysaccharide-induced tumor necrosis factor-alpha factor homolog [Sceloporus undulatus]|uniref:lipopolysaccharide-induced tumor necrosis factor-alpha factor homolog n=1 Tax=Sceloporus undulatus TaxID=8520 RepID=UPI001C4D4A8F|nr:lipopolysaccharide-induced tumor necrosis factor-alpha factor homolog [Sceloporus undulatus]